MRLILPALIPVKTVKDNEVWSKQLDSVKTVLKIRNFEQQEMEHNVNSTVLLLSRQKKKITFLVLHFKGEVPKNVVSHWKRGSWKSSQIVWQQVTLKGQSKYKPSMPRRLKEKSQRKQTGSDKYLTQTPSFGKQIRKDHLIWHATYSLRNVL